MAPPRVGPILSPSPSLLHPHPHPTPAPHTRRSVPAALVTGSRTTGIFSRELSHEPAKRGEKKKPTHHCLEILPSRCRAALAPREGNPLLHQPGGARTLLRAQPRAGTRSRRRRRQPGQRNPAARPATARARVRADAGQDTRQADASSTPPHPQAHSAVKAFPKTLFRLSFSRTKVREARAAPQRRSRRALSHGSRVGSVRGSPAAPRPPADKAPGPPGSGRAAANKGSSGAAGRGGAAPPARER